jgi:hypothetical protein
VSKAHQPKPLPPPPTEGGSYLLNAAGDGWERQPAEDTTPDPLIEDQDDAQV